MLTKLRNKLRALRHDRRGSVAILAAVSMPVILGSLGIGVEVASWQATKRSLQNAADSAAMAAATNGSGTYLTEASAVARRYGFQNGQGGVTVTAVNNQVCPDGSTKCYRVTIAKVQPLLLAQVVGFNGDTEVDGQPAKLIQATALAIQGESPREYCVVALATSGTVQGIRANGVPKANLAGCSVMSNTNAVCNGHDLNADFGDANGTSDGCGHVQNSNVKKIEDQYASRASKIPANPCNGNYFAAPSKKKDDAWPSANTLVGLLDKDSYAICGDGHASGPIIVSKPNTVITVYGGSLDLEDYTMITQPGASVTLLFAGPNLSGHKHIPMGTGGFNIEAPKTGDWAGVAMYQDPALTSGVDLTEAGNTPTWDITGLVYMPHSSVTFSGVVNKSSNGASCFVLVVDNVTINGTGSILNHGGCKDAGLIMPSTPVPSRGELVS
jgi:hypothetical protein